MSLEKQGEHFDIFKNFNFWFFIYLETDEFPLKTKSIKNLKMILKLLPVSFI